MFSRELIRQFLQFWFVTKTSRSYANRSACDLIDEKWTSSVIQAYEAVQTAVKTSTWLIVITEQEVLGGFWRTMAHCDMMPTLWHKQAKIPFFHTDTQTWNYLIRWHAIHVHWDWLFCPSLFSADLPKALCFQVSFLFPRRSSLCRTRQMETASTLQQSTS